MSESTKIYGFRWKYISTGERVPDCNITIRFLMHWFWLCMFRIIPLRWQLGYSGKIRNKIGDTVLKGFGWWSYSHCKYYGYSKREWIRNAEYGSQS